MPKFKTAYGEKLHPSQDFDHTKITFTKAGKKYNIYDVIQTAREDTELYPTLEKYGMIPNVENAEQFCKNRGNAFFAEFSETMDKRDVHELNKKSEEMWLDLPREVREIFHNDKEEFMTTGLEWWDKTQKALLEKEAEMIKNTEGVTNNEQK